MPWIITYSNLILHNWSRAHINKASDDWYIRLCIVYKPWNSFNSIIFFVCTIVSIFYDLRISVNGFLNWPERLNARKKLLSMHRHMKQEVTLAIYSTFKWLICTFSHKTQMRICENIDFRSKRREIKTVCAKCQFEYYLWFQRLALSENVATILSQDMLLLWLDVKLFT